MPKIILFANTDWYLYNFRLALAQELRELGNEIILLSPPGDFQNLLLENGFQWIPFQLSRQGVNPFAEVRTLLSLIRLYRRIRPDIVHHFTIKPVIYGSLSARILGIGSVINSITGLGHLFIDPGMSTRILRSLAKILYRAGLHNTQVIFENPEDRSTFIRNKFIRPEQSTLIPGTGVDIGRFKPAKKDNLTPVVLFSSRLLATKGILEFVQAAQQLKRSGSAARFAVAGMPDPGNPASIPPGQIEAWKRSGFVELWGWQDDMPAALARTDIFCLPSYREGVPSALLEACAAGLPIVATDVPGCRDVVRHGVNGLLVPPQDADALAEAIQELLSDPDQRAEMGQAGRRFALEIYSREKIVSQTLEVYKRTPKGRTAVSLSRG